MTVLTEPELTWELVRSRNSMERLKHEKMPLDVISEISSIARRGYEGVSDADIVRLRWYGLHHDRPKQGCFMLRVMVPGGALTPLQLRTVGQLSQEFGANFGELTTRQNVQLHSITLDQLPAIFAALARVGLPSTGGGGDTVRAITGCPVSALDAEELFDVRPVIQAVASFFQGHRDYSDLPRKLKISIAACPHQCEAPEIQCVALVGLRQRDRQGFAVRVGGGLSSTPRLSDDLKVFVPSEDVIPVLRGIIDEWKEDLASRMSRGRARLKFMLADLTPDAFRTRLEERLGYPLAVGAAPVALECRHNHNGVHPQKQTGRYYAGFPVRLGLVNGGQMVEIANLVESYGGEIRLTRRQDLILAHIPETRLPAVLATMTHIGFPLSGNPSRVSALACTGRPYCNYAGVETKLRLAQLVEHLEKVFGDAVGQLELNLDGCSHACAHHWIGDIGLQSTTAREPGGDGPRPPAFDIYLRGGLGRYAAIGRPVVRRVPGEEVHFYVERLVRAYLDGRNEGETMQAFFTRLSDDELVAIAMGDQQRNP